MLYFRGNLWLLLILPLLGLLSCGWNDTSSVSPYPDVHYAVYYFGDRGIIEADYCDITHSGASYSDSVSAKISDFVVISTPDSQSYFYSPKQGNLPDLSIRRSIEALLILLHDSGYFGSVPKRPNVAAETNVGITISGAQDAADLTFTNNLNRFVAVSTQGTERVVSAGGGISPTLLSFVSAELGTVVENSGGSSDLPCEISPPPDTVFLFNANSLTLLLEPLSAPYFDEFGEIDLEGISRLPSLYSRLCVADIFQIYSLAMYKIGGDSLFASAIDGVEDALTGALEASAEASERIFADSPPPSSVAPMGPEFRRVLATEFWGVLIDSLAVSEDSSFGPAPFAVANAFRLINDGVDTLNFFAETYTRPPFAKWAGRVPVVQIESPADHTVFTGTDSINMTGSAYDPIDGAISAENLVWESSVDGELGRGAAISSSLAPGEHMIILSAVNSDSIFGADTISITIEPNTPPTVWIISPSDGDTLSMIMPSIFIGGASDAEDGIIAAENLVWTSNRDGVIGTGFVFTTNLSSMGRHTIVLTATDSGGLSAADSIKVRVRPF